MITPKPKIDGYTIKEKIYISSRTVVYSGIKDDDKKNVIIKTTYQANPSDREIARLHYEYQLLGSMNVPGIVRPVELIQYQTSHALILEDFGGQSLNNFIKIGEGIDLKIFFRISIEILKILSLIHSKGITHKDICPQNICWDKNRNLVKIIDFSIASCISQELFGTSADGVIEGSLPYLSPEQTGRINRNLDYRSDFYSLGITFFELLTGQLPFYADDAIGWAHAHIAKQLPAIHEIRQDIPPVLSKIIAKMCAKNPDERYQSSFGILSDLNNAYQFWIMKGVSFDFIIGDHDVPDHFQIPQKLYERGHEYEYLINLFNNVSCGSSEILMITGQSGIGKSALVKEVKGPIVTRSGYFIEGKFDQFKRNIPYSAITDAFNDLTKQILSESPEKIQNWKKTILQALGVNGRIITDLIPELIKLIDVQPEIVECKPTEAQNRFDTTFSDFVRAITSGNRPIVIFLDDLQWADSSSLLIIAKIITSSDIHNLMVVGAYRHNEVKPSDPLILSLEEIRRNKKVHEIILNPLSESSIFTMVAETLHLKENDVSQLSEVVFRRTDGNPFFIGEFLKNLYREGWLFFDNNKGSWNWDINKVKAADAPENVIDFLIGRFKKLPNETIELLKIAACIGNYFDLKTLKTISNTPINSLAKKLWPALHQGIIIPLNDTYKLVQQAQTTAYLQYDTINVFYKFQHDRVQQTAYSLIDKSQKATLHLNIGEMLLQFSDKKQIEERIIEIVRHINEGIVLVNDDKRKISYAALNLQAAKKAKDSMAYDSAYNYLSIAGKLLPAGSWESGYQLAFDIHKESAECAYLSGNFDA
ncbi:MAG: serine/threonine-protein kinase PknK, partial [Oligoflexales bacterium]|nr:serine/threonine-protein kinase PknK [Oligoflexales bacterium]